MSRMRTFVLVGSVTVASAFALACSSGGDGACAANDCPQLADASADGGSPDDAGTDPQQAYTYPGCDDAGSYGCPKMLVYACALHTIENAHADGCSLDSDCELVPFRDCVSVYGCQPPAVLAAQVSTFTNEFAAERDRYCAGSHCKSFPQCVFNPLDYRPFCVQGRCVALIPDGGMTDAGSGDGG